MNVNEMMMALGTGGILATAVILWVVSIIAYWKMFEKAGEPGWKSIIPVYSSYTLFKIGWKASMFWVWVVLVVAAAILSGIHVTALAVIGMILYILSLIFWIVFMVKLAKAYGKGAGFAVGLIILWPIFVLILGFGSAEYQGAQA